MQERQHTSEPVTPHALTSALCRAARVKESKSQSQEDRLDGQLGGFVIISTVKCVYMQ